MCYLDSPDGRANLMTIDQRITASKLQAEGFTVSEYPTGVVAVRGNDHRVIYRDGSMKRARGARR